MRTTIELRDDLRAKLLHLSAERGEKGFSRLVEEALENFLAQVQGAEKRRQAALRLRGSLSAEEAEVLRERVARIHKSWR